MKTVFIKKYKNSITMIVVGLVLLSALLWAVVNNTDGIAVADNTDFESNSSESETDSRAQSRSVVKNETFYLHQTQQANYVFDYSTTTVFNTMVGNNLTNLSSGGGKVRVNWYLHPVLAGDFYINGSIFLLLNVQMRSDSNNFNGAINIEVYDVSFIDAGGTRTESLIASGTSGNIVFTTSVAGYGATITGVDYTVPQNHSLRVFVEITGGSSNYYFMLFGDNVYDSHLVFQSEDYLEVDQVYTKDYQGNAKSNFLLDESNKTIELVADVTDPFGGYDIKMVNMTLKSPTDATLIDHQGMTKFQGTNISFVNSFHLFWNYTGAPTGQYSMEVWAVDWNGYNYYYYKQNFDFGVYPDTNTGIFFIGGQPLSGNVTVFDSLGNPLPGATVKATLGGQTIYSSQSNSTGVANLQGYPGIYTIIVIWQDILVKTHTDFDFKNDFPLELTCDVFYPQFKIVDNSGATLKGANVYIGHPNGSFAIVPYVTDANGLITLDRAPIGNYNIIVKWRDVEVANVIDLVDKNGLIDTIKCAVYNVQLTVVDSKNIGLPKAQIVIADNLSKLVLDSQISTLAGVMTSQLPLGDYTISVYWMQRLVKELDLSINMDYSDVIVCDVFYVYFLVVDTHNETVENAVVVITDKDTDAAMDSNSSNSAGLLESRLPAGESNVDVYWQSILVHSSLITITGDLPATNPILLKSDIYYLNLNCLDSHGIPLNKARVDIFHSFNSELVDSKESDSDGKLVFRLALGSFDFTVTWFDIEVFNQADFQLNQDRTLNIFCSVYYINITPLDSKNVILENARIEIVNTDTDKIMMTGDTGSVGTANFRIPAGSFAVDIDWLGIGVSSTVQTITKDEDFIITCDVYYTKIKPVDSQSKIIENARVDVINKDTGRIVQTKSVGSTGSVEMRLPANTYIVRIYWLDINVSYTVQTFASNDDVTINCNVFYLTIKVVDITNIPVENANVFVNYNQITNIFDSGVTDEEGILVSRLPIGIYALKVTWKDVEVFSTLNASLTEDRTLIAASKIYYLTITSVDKDGNKLSDVLVTIYNEDTNPLLSEAGYTSAKGTYRFRLPHGSYFAQGRLITTHLLADIDQKTTGQADLSNGSTALELKFEEFPPAAYKTPAFAVASFAILMLILFLLLWLFVIRKLKNQIKEGEPKDISKDKDEEIDEQKPLIPDKTEEAPPETVNDTPLEEEQPADVAEEPGDDRPEPMEDGESPSENVPEKETE